MKFSIVVLAAAALRQVCIPRKQSNSHFGIGFPDSSRAILMPTVIKLPISVMDPGYLHTVFPTFPTIGRYKLDRKQFGRFGSRRSY